MKISKLQKKIYSLFCAIFALSLGAGSLLASADDLGYEGCSSAILKMVDVRSKTKDMLISVEWAILKFLADAIDYFDNAVSILLKLNLYDYLSDAFSFGSMQAAVAAAASIALIIGVCAMVIFHDKIHVSDFLMSVMVSMILLIAFPSFISACNALKTRGVKAAQHVEIEGHTENSSVDKEGVVTLSSLGSDLLGEGVYDVVNSVDYKKKMSYTDVIGNSANVKNINITGVLEPTDSKPWTKYYVTDINDVQPEQKKYSELTTENMMELLGLSREYYAYTHVNDKFILVTTMLSNGGIGCILYTSQHYPGGCVVSEEDSKTIVSASFGTTVPYSVEIGSLAYSDGSHITNVNSFESYLKDAIANNGYVRDAGLTQTVGANSRTIEEALEIIKDDVIRDLNIKANTRNVKSSKNITTEYKAEPLFTEEDYEDLDDQSMVKSAVREYIDPGYIADYLYYWHIDFLSTLCLMLAVLICMIFSGIKVTTTLFEIMFSQLITPFVIATDLNNSGRAKKAIQNMLLSNIILMIVVILFRLYLSVVWGVRESKYGDNFAVVLIVIIAGAKFVIDGPDILTKLFGIDAGVKSGAGAIMALSQATQMGGYTAMSALNMGGHTLGAVKNGGQKIAQKAGGAASGAIKGMAGGVYGGVSQGNSTLGKVGRSIGGATVGGTVGAVGGAFGHSDIGAKAGYNTAGGTDNIKQSVGEAKDHFTDSFKNMCGADGGSSMTQSSGGMNGKDGQNGAPGVNGAAGEKGADGKQGEKGQGFNPQNNQNDPSSGSGSAGSQTATAPESKATASDSNNSKPSASNSRNTSASNNTDQGSTQGSGFSEPSPSTAANHDNAPRPTAKTSNNTKNTSDPSAEKGKGL